MADGYQLRDYFEKRANALDETFPDGRKLFLGSPGTRAPDPEQFPTDKAADKTKTPDK